LLWLPAGALGIYIAGVGQLVHRAARSGKRGRGIAVGLVALTAPSLAVAYFVGSVAWLILGIMLFGYFVMAPLVWRFIVGPQFYDDRRFLWPWQTTHLGEPRGNHATEKAT
jgi:hypothetical protein